MQSGGITINPLKNQSFVEIKGYFYLGKVLRPVGIQGKLLIYLDVDDPGQYRGLDAVFVYVGGNLVPFLINEIQMQPGKQAQVSFRDVDSIDQVEMLAGAALYLPVEALPELGENEFYYHEITGFIVVDHEYGELGLVEKVLDYPLQALLQINRGEKEILIPVADEIITTVDKKNRIINIKAPEGLIEMYLE